MSLSDEDLLEAYAVRVAQNAQRKRDNKKISEEEWKFKTEILRRMAQSSPGT
jgi:hypothetical protein